jgi:hypothetical protein
VEKQWKKVTGVTWTGILLKPFNSIVCETEESEKELARITKRAAASAIGLKRSKIRCVVAQAFEA